MDKLDRLLELAAILRSFGKDDNIERIRPILREFMSARPLLGISRSSHQVWHRARKIEDVDYFRTLSDLIYAPPAKAKYNRANLPGCATLYAAWNESTALDEIQTRTGDIVQVVALRPIAGIELPCHVVGEYQLFNASGRSMVGSEKLMKQLTHELQNEHQKFILSLFIDSVCSTFFRANVPEDEPEGYKITALYSELLLDHGGLIYPSVRNAGAMNIAISAQTFDSQFEIIGTRVYEIKRNLGYGLYELAILRQSCDFEPDGTINWNSAKLRQISWTPQEGIREVGPSFPGWRKPTNTAQEASVT